MTGIGTLAQVNRYIETLRKPRWIAAVVVGVLLAGVCVRLGFWQLDRLDQRRERNATIEARSDEIPRPLIALRTDFDDDPAEMAFRPAIVEGRYLADDEFFSIGRIYGDVVGTLVATPLDVGGDDVLIVVRGLVPAGTDGPPAVGSEVPPGAVVVEGRLAPGEEPSRIGEQDPASGHLDQVSRLDLAYIDQWVPGDVLPYVLLLDEQRPAGPGTAPTPIPGEELSEGNHLGYALQWFAFAIIALVGTAVLIRRASQRPDDGDV